MSIKFYLSGLKMDFNKCLLPKILLKLWINNCMSDQNLGMSIFLFVLCFLLSLCLCVSTLRHLNISHIHSLSILFNSFFTFFYRKLFLMSWIPSSPPPPPRKISPYLWVNISTNKEYSVLFSWSINHSPRYSRVRGSAIFKINY